MDLNAILVNVRKAIAPQRRVDMDEAGLHILLEPLVATDESKILEACKDLDGSQYMEAVKRCSLACSIKKINEVDLSAEDIVYEEEGQKKTKSRFLYMKDYLGQWPSAFVDILFDAFTDLQTEVEARVAATVKFERFKVTEKPAEDAKAEFRKVEEPEEELDENQKLQKQVDQEIAAADAEIAKQNA